MEKRYQVFVSSTFNDLHEERQEVMQALLELNCIPSGMELFPAANEDQWTLIKRIIDDCDYYLVIIGGRYGSLGPSGLSYTEMEYRYALERGKPIIAFIHRDPGTLPSNRTETDPDGRRKLEEFRLFVQQKTVRFWQSPSELSAVVSRSIVHMMQTTAARGWVRAEATNDTTAHRPLSAFHWERTGNLFWLSHDVTYTINMLLHSGSSASIMRGLHQTRHHLSEMGMGETSFGIKLNSWIQDAESVQENWTAALRGQLARRLDRLVAQIGTLAAEQQGDYKAGPDK